MRIQLFAEGNLVAERDGNDAAVEILAECVKSAGLLVELAEAYAELKEKYHDGVENADELSMVEQDLAETVLL